MNLALIGQAVLEEKIFEKVVIYMYIAPGMGGQPPGVIFF